MFCEMCPIKIYNKSEKVDLKDGGILLRGHLVNEMQQKVDGITHIQVGEYDAGVDNTVIMEIG